MRSSKPLIGAFYASLVVFSGIDARADDTEIFFSSTVDAAAPNILLILDTSGSMHEEIQGTANPYDPNKTYSVSGCDTNAVYYSTSGIPKCSSSNKIPKANFHCSAADVAFAASGRYLDGHYARWMKKTVKGKYSNTTTYYWSNDFNPKDTSSTDYTPQTDITCKEDTDSNYPTRGEVSSSSNMWSGTSTNNHFSTSAGSTYAFYDGNWLAYYNDPNEQGISTRMAEMKKAATQLIDSLSGVNVGLMRYSADGDGGMVIAPIQDVTTGATALKQAINDMHHGGTTPLSETLYEAYLYFAGKPAKFGTSSQICTRDDDTTCRDYRKNFNSVSPPLSGGTYTSPITNACQNNYIVFLTDGVPYEDTAANSDIEALDSGTGCYSSTDAIWQSLGYPKPSTTSGGTCLKEMARVLYTKDMRPGDTLPGTQNVTTFFIGFGDEVASGGPQAYLQEAAAAGGGRAATARNATELVDSFDQFFSEILNTSATFNSPSVAVNSFNKTQVLEDLYVAMFEPAKTTRWPGNLKKFKLRDGAIIGQNSSASAVNPATGFFTNSAEDFWQQGTGGSTSLTKKGGAANRLPPPASRKLYTYIGDNRPGSFQALSSHPVSTSNSAIDDAVLDVTEDDPPASVLINWARGDLDGDLSTTDDARNEMGDPIHSQPAVVIYGNTGATTTAQLNDAVVFIATNDGYLHAIDVVTGEERWAYIPQELLRDLKNLYADKPAATKHYSLDGDIRVLKYDVDGDGIVEPAAGDRVFLYFSQGRGGDRYYALDVTIKDDPKFMWSLGSSDLSGIVNKSWSTPSLGRVKVGDGSNQNTQKLVLIFGGGYDDVEDAIGFIPNDTYGNGVFMVDALNGTLLWSQTKTDEGAFAKMTHAIPASVTVIDTNNDGWSDRMYVGDMAGQLWRFDITNGAPAEELVAGGVIASLGGKESATTADNRSFYNSPDVARFIVQGGSNFYNIAIGSGDRGLPRSNMTTQDRFYAIRDYYLGPLTQEAYDNLTPIVDADLLTIDGTTAPVLAEGAPGWKLPLTTGEKVLAQSVTSGGVVMFTTYLPGSSASACSVSAGSARAYTIDVLSGTKYFDDLYEEFSTTGLPPPITLINEDQVIRTDGTTPPDDEDGDDGEGSGSGPGGGPGTCLSGVTIFERCVEFGARVKTFWQDAGSY